MTFECEIEQDCELQYQVAMRPERNAKQRNKNLSPRFAKQRAPEGARNGIHRRRHQASR